MLALLYTYPCLPLILLLWQEKQFYDKQKKKLKNEQLGWVTQEIRGQHWLQCNESILRFSTCNEENNELLRGKSL